MKPLKPSLLIKGIVYRDEIEQAIFDFIGVLGYAEAAPHFIISGNKNIILSINRESLEKIRASFLMCEKQIEIILVSGSLKKLQN